jgi:hypothetical protein
MPTLRSAAGTVVTVSDEQAPRLRRRGWRDAATAVEAPAKSATKAEWVAYAASQGATDADKATKADLIEQYG